MERPPADPAKLLASWADGETGEITPGRALADLKTGGLRDVLDHLAAAGEPGPTELLAAWMTWERGQANPTTVLGRLLEGGLRSVLEQLVAEAGAPVEG